MRKREGREDRKPKPPGGKGTADRNFPGGKTKTQVALGGDPVRGKKRNALIRDQKGRTSIKNQAATLKTEKRGKNPTILGPALDRSKQGLEN